MKKIKEKISRFFEEEEENESEEEINLKTLIIIFLIGFVIIISIYVYTNKGFEFINFNLDERENMEENEGGIEQDKILEITNYFENYFVGEKGLENSDFSDNMYHWSTSDGGELYKGAVSKRTLNKKDYHSPPQSLHIDCSQPACRVYYDIRPHSIILNNPYDFKSGIWMGVKPGSKFKVTYWYKGGPHTFYLMGLGEKGPFENLKIIESENSIEWIEKKLIGTIPNEMIAVGIEITMNSEGTLLIDDIRLEISE